MDELVELRPPLDRPRPVVQLDQLFHVDRPRSTPTTDTLTVHNVTPEEALSVESSSGRPGILGFACSTACYKDSVGREITQRELRNQSGEIMRELDEGESFVVTRNGVPVGELTPLRRHRFVAAETAVALFRSAPALDYQRFRADLDANASQDLTPRA